MKLVSFNIRYDCGRDGENNFCFRKPLILDKIRTEMPDIVCFQEVLPHVAVWLKDALREYYIVGCPRGAVLDDEQVCIAFRPDRYNLMKMDTFWLSPEPETPGSRYPEQSICPRVCTELVLQEFASGQVFRVFSIHLDHASAEVRRLAVHQLLGRLDAETFFPQVPAILAGDFNAEPDSEEIRTLCAAPGIQNRTADVGATFHDFGRCSGIQIDYIFTRGCIACTHVETWSGCRDGVYLSDHNPVCAELTFAT